MKVLSLDTSSPACTVAVVEIGPGVAELIAEINAWSPRGHMARLISQIEETLNQAGVVREELEAVVVGVGPGSFTGLRIGVSIARTLAQLMEIPIAGVPSLDALVQRLIFFRGIICPIIDAKRGEVYTAVYESDGSNIKRLGDFRPILPARLTDELSTAGYKKVLFAGDGVGAYRKIFEESMGARALFTPPDEWWPRAAELVHAASERLAKGEFDDLDALVPIYARLSQAEEVWLKRSGRS